MSTAETLLTFRDAGIEDAEVIAEIYNQSIVVGDSTMEDDLQSADTMRRKIEGFNDREVILLLERQDPASGKAQILGWGIIKRYSDRAGYRFACETAVYLWRDQIGHGYGSKIKQALIDRAREWNYHHLVAKILATNTPSIEYNRKFGYELVGIQKEIGFRDGERIDIAILQLVLDNTKD